MNKSNTKVTSKMVKGIDKELNIGRMEGRNTKVPSKMATGMDLELHIIMIHAFS